MSASYPGAIKSWTSLVDDVDDAVAANVNTIYDEVTAIETKLGVNVQGGAASLVVRLAKSHDSLGRTSYADPGELTISSGSVTATANFHYIDTQGDGATDDLDTISGPSTGENWLLFVRIAADARNVVIKHGTGNIYCAGGKDITLDTTADLAVLIYDNVQDKWLATAQQIYTGANTWTGLQSFGAGVIHKYTAINDSATLDSSYYTVDVTTASANKTVTLPPAASYPGIVYNIRKASNNAYTVTIDGDGSETINGAATYVISVAYETATIQSTGSAWILL